MQHNELGTILALSGTRLKIWTVSIGDEKVILLILERSVHKLTACRIIPAIACRQYHLLLESTIEK